MSEQIQHGNHSTVGFGDQLAAPPPMIVAAPSPWLMAFATTAFAAATGWVIEELASTVRGRRRR